MKPTYRIKIDGVRRPDAVLNVEDGDMASWTVEYTLDPAKGTDGRDGFGSIVEIEQVHGEVVRELMGRGLLVGIENSCVTLAGNGPLFVQLDRVTMRAERVWRNYYERAARDRDLWRDHQQRSEAKISSQREQLHDLERRYQIVEQNRDALADQRDTLMREVENMSMQRKRTLTIHVTMDGENGCPTIEAIDAGS